MSKTFHSKTINQYIQQIFKFGVVIHTFQNYYVNGCPIKPNANVL